MHTLIFPLLLSSLALALYNLSNVDISEMFIFRLPAFSASTHVLLALETSRPLCLQIFFLPSLLPFFQDSHGVFVSVLDIVLWVPNILFLFICVT